MNNIKIHLPVMSQMTMLQYEYELQVCLTYTYFFENKKPKNWKELEHNIEIIKLRQHIKIMLSWIRYNEEKDIWRVFNEIGIVWVRSKGIEVKHYNQYIIGVDPITV